MTFPWTTEAQRRKQRQDEDFARRAVADLTLRLRCGREIEGTITEIDRSGMAEILKRQGEVNVLRPARRRTLVVGQTGTGRSTLADLFKNGAVNHD
jgi:polynucleotide 5'-kinase involved in rRNA processing